MEENDNTLELQERELHRLCDTGFHFTVTRRVRRRPKGIRRFFSRGRVENEEMRFEVLQPTLDVLSRVAPHMVHFQRYADMVKEAEDSALLEAAKSTIVEAQSMAKLVAIMVMGEKYYMYDTTRGQYVRDDAGLRQLEDVMLHHLQPSRLFSICEACLAVANLADFMNSIRLLAAETESVASPRKNRVE